MINTKKILLIVYSLLIASLLSGCAFSALGREGAISYARDNIDRYRYDKAMLDLYNAEQYSSKNLPETQAEIFYLRALCYEKQGKAKLAIALYENISKNFTSTDYANKSNERLEFLNDNREIIRKTLSDFGVESYIDDLIEYLKGRGLKDISELDPTIKNNLTKIIDDFYNNYDFFSSIINKTNEKFDKFQKNYYLIILEWLEREQNMLHFYFTYPNATYIYQLKEEPLAKERQKLLKRIDYRTSFSEITATIVTNTLLAIVEALNKSNIPYTYKDKKDMGQVKAMIIADVRERNLINLSYRYRNFEDKKIEEYADYFKSGDGRWFIDHLNKNILAVMEDVTNDIKEEVIKSLRNS